jgi:biotin carboxylase
VSEYDEIYICNEDLLALVFHFAGKDGWKGLLLPEPDTLKTLLSKNSTIAFAQSAGIAAPRTFIPVNEREIAQLAERLGFPLVVKGERGESAVNVRVVKSAKDLVPTYLRIKRREESYRGMPALEEFIPGTGYSVGGLFHQGRALRVCAHRKILTYPPEGGQTVKGITERPPALLESALRLFGALRYNGLGHMEFIQDRRDERFKFLEINPRIWGSISIAECAGVDLFCIDVLLSTSSFRSTMRAARSNRGASKIIGSARHSSLGNPNPPGEFAALAGKAGIAAFARAAAASPRTAGRRDAQGDGRESKPDGFRSPSARSES